MLSAPRAAPSTLPRVDLPGLLLTLALGLVIAYLASVAYCAWVLTHPPRRNYAWAVARSVPGDPKELRSVGPGGGDGLAYDSWSFESARDPSKQLPVWDITGLAPDGPIIIFTHGWGDSRVVALPRLAALARFASRIVAWDLPGHGESPRSLRFTLGSHESADLAALVERVAPPPERLILAGSSLGAGVSIEAVGRGLVRPAGVIAEAPYRVPIVPARNVMRNAGIPWRLNLPVAQALLGLRFARDPRWPWGQGRRPFDRALWAARLRELNIPMLVIHGDQDNVCPLEDAHDIAAAAGTGATLAVIPGAGHLDLWTRDTNRDLCVKAVSEWLKHLPV